MQQCLLADSSLLNAAGTTGAAVFLIDMNKAFEDFVTSRLTRYPHGQLHLAPQQPADRDTAAKVQIKPDLTFTHRYGQAAYVADTKYKITSSGYGREADYYQILAYATALGVPEGMLIYCQHDGSTPPRQVQVRNLGTRLTTWPLHLDRDPARWNNNCRPSPRRFSSVPAST
jgi:5-methylcytosine-specific restriction enzyme subunit McrC